MTTRRVGHGWRRVIAGMVVVALSGCSSDPAEPDALVPSSTNVGTWGFTPNDKETLAVGGTPLHVLRPVTLESATIRTTEGDLELLATRVSLFACRECRRRSDVIGYAGHAGSACTTDPWPPPGYGPSYPLAGFSLAPGDRPSILVYFRARTPRAKTDGVTVKYTDGRDRHAVHIRTDTIEIRPPESPAGDGCGDSLWFGATNTQHDDLVLPLDGEATATP